jgi:tellurite resistance protein TerC
VFTLAAAAAVVAGLALERRLFAPGREPRRNEAIGWSIGWLALALAVAAAIGAAGGPVGEWSTVYLIERSLSLDNAFLFTLLLAYFAVPAELRGPVVTIGIAGALALRGVAIVVGVTLIEMVEAVVYIFGALLLYVAYRAFRGADEEADPANNLALRFVRRVLPTTDGFRGKKLFVRERGRLMGTPLLLTIVAIVAADIAFAIDSIPAAFAVTRDPAVIWTANAFALLGLGALLALVDILVRRFRYLDKTIAVILAFVGVKILADDVVQIGDLASLGVIVGLLGGGIAASLIADRLQRPQPVEEARRRPPRCPSSSGRFLPSPRTCSSPSDERASGYVLHQRQAPPRRLRPRHPLARRTRGRRARQADGVVGDRSGTATDLAFTLAATPAVVAGLALERRLFAPGREPRRNKSITWSIGWLVLALAVAAAIRVPVPDALLLANFAVPAELRGPVVTIGLAGAPALREVAIGVGWL